MKKRRNGAAAYILSAAALCMTVSLTLQGASAYFTTYVSAGGSHTVTLGSQTEIHEDLSDMTKHVSITNTSQINDCYVRVKVFYGGQLQVSYQDRSESGKLWTYSETDGYWYYGPILPAGASTELFYKGILKSGRETKPFADTIRIDGKLASEARIETNGNVITTTYKYDGVEFHVDVEVDAVQTHNAQDAIKSAWGADAAELGIL